MVIDERGKIITIKDEIQLFINTKIITIFISNWLGKIKKQWIFLKIFYKILKEFYDFRQDYLLGIRLEIHGKINRKLINKETCIFA